MSGSIGLAVLVALVAVVAFAFGASRECDCQKRARRARQLRGKNLDAAVDAEVRKLRERGWL